MQEVMDQVPMQAATVGYLANSHMNRQIVTNMQISSTKSSTSKPNVGDATVTSPSRTSSQVSSRSRKSTDKSSYKSSRSSRKKRSSAKKDYLLDVCLFFLLLSFALVCISLSCKYVSIQTYTESHFNFSVSLDH